MKKPCYGQTIGGKGASRSRYVLVSVAASRFFTGVGMSAAWVVLMAVGYGVMRSSAGMGMLLVLANLPGLFTSPAAGALADRFAKRPLIVVSRLVTAGVLLGGLALGGTRDALLLSALVIALGGISGFLYGPFDAYILEIVDRARLTRVNALIQSVWSLSLFVGPVAGGAILAAGTVSAGILFSAGSLALSALALFFLPRAEIDPSGRRAGPGLITALARDLAEGCRTLRRSPSCRFLLLFFAFFYGTYCLTSGVWMPYCEEILGPGTGLRGSTIYAAVDAAAGLSGFLGAFLVPWIMRRRGKIWALFLGAGLSALELLVMGLLPNLFVVVGTLSLTGVSVVLLMVPLFALIQGGVEPGFAGRTMGALDAAVNGVSLLSFGIGGLLADRFGVRPVFVAAGLLLACGLFLIALGPGCRKVRDSERRYA
jgi:MFS family permease